MPLVVLVLQGGQHCTCYLRTSQGKDGGLRAAEAEAPKVLTLSLARSRSTKVFAQLQPTAPCSPSR